MEDSLSIETTSLSKYPQLADFFSQNSSYTKYIGANSTEEKKLIRNYEKDIAYYRHRISYSEAKQDPGQFNIKAVLGAFNTPIKGPAANKKAESSNVHFEKPGKTSSQKSEQAAPVLTKIYQFIKRLGDEKRYGQNISLKTASFLSTKQNVTEGLDNNSLLALKDKTASSKEEIVDYIAKKAFNDFEGKTSLSVDNFKQRIEESLFLILNIGDILSTLKNNQEARNSFSAGSLYSKESLKNEMAGKALETLGRQDVITRDSLVENIEAAAYLLGNKEYAREIARTEGNLNAFLTTIGRDKEDFLQYVVGKAQEILDRSRFTDVFLESNSDFSSLVAGSEHMGRSISLGGFINSDPGLTEEEFDLNDLVFRYQAFSIAEMLPQNTGVTKDFFTSKKGILNTALSDRNFVSNLSRSIETVDKYFSSDTDADEPDADNVFKAYLLGLSDRKE